MKTNWRDALKLARCYRSGDLKKVSAATIVAEVGPQSEARRITTMTAGPRLDPRISE